MSRSHCKVPHKIRKLIEIAYLNLKFFAIKNIVY
jgi:hypothetical protein